MLELVKSQTVCFTGHRSQKLPWRFNEEDARCKAMKETWTIVKEIDRKKRKERTVLKKSFLWGGVLLCSRKEIMFKLVRG